LKLQIEIGAQNATYQSTKAVITSLNLRSKDLLEKMDGLTKVMSEQGQLRYQGSKDNGTGVIKS